jgi:hypothetical protein
LRWLLFKKRFEFFLSNVAISLYKKLVDSVCSGARTVEKARL